MSQVQSVAIKAGHLLEDIIADKTNLIPDKDLDAFVDDCNNTNTISGTFLCTKDMTKKSRYYVNGHEPDLMIFQIENGRGSRSITTNTSRRARYKIKKKTPCQDFKNQGRGYFVSKFA